MIIKIVTDCAYAGCSTTHYVKVMEGTSEGEIEEIAEQILQTDIEPTVFWEVVDEDDLEEYDEIEEL